jgi:hypothetical protein
MKTLTLFAATAVSLLAATSPAFSAGKASNGGGNTKTTTSRVNLQPKNARDWATLCTTKPQSWEEASSIAGLCLWYPRGLADGLSMYEETADARVCIDPKVTSGQLRDVVIQYIKANPKDQHKDFNITIIYAFADAWPCEQKTVQPNPSNQPKKTDAAPVTEFPRAE